MTVNEARKLLLDAGHRILSEERLGNDSGTALRLEGGQIVNVFDKGTCNVQGTNQQAVKQLLAQANPSAASRSNKVFVVYGHDADAATQLEAMLRRWGLEPLVLPQLASEGKTIIEKLEKYTSVAHFGVVLATPDDEGHRAGHPDEKRFRVRQNVVLELGMLLTRLGRERVAILLKNATGTERPSDIDGLIYIPFRDTVEDAKVTLAKELNAQGYHVDITRL